MRAIIVLVGTLFVAVAACSTADPMPSSFHAMASDEIGCTIEYGDDDLYVIGPLGTSDSGTVEPNDYTSFGLGRTAADFGGVAEGSDWKSHAAVPIDEITIDGVVILRGPFRSSGDPGFVVTCWQGSS